MSEHVLTEMSALEERGSDRPQRKYNQRDRKRLLKLYERRGGSKRQFAREQGTFPNRCHAQLLRWNLHHGPRRRCTLTSGPAPNTTT